MPGTRHEPATAPARVMTRRGWRAMRPLEPALEALHRAAGTPVTARLAWWRAAVTANPGTVPLVLALRGQRGTITAAALVALRDEIEAVHQARDHDAGRVSDLDDSAGLAFWRSVYEGHAARGELEVATLRLDGHLAAYVIALADSPAYRVFDGRFAPKWRLYSPGRRLEAAVVEHARRGSYLELDWMSSVAPEKLVASTQADPRWAVTATSGRPSPARAAASCPWRRHREGRTVRAAP